MLIFQQFLQLAWNLHTADHCIASSALPFRSATARRSRAHNGRPDERVMSETRKHAPITGFPVVGNSISVGGIALPRLAGRAGGTPFYAYDRGLLTRRVGERRRALPGWRTAFLRGEGESDARGDPASGRARRRVRRRLGAELKSVLDTTTSPEQLSFAGPGKTESELARAVVAGVLVNMESEREMEALAQIAQRQAIRRRPSFWYRTHMATIDTVKQVLGDTLQLGARAGRLTAETPLLRSMPELDSMAIVTVITALEEAFGFYVRDEEVSAEIFESVGSLARFVEKKLAG